VFLGSKSLIDRDLAWNEMKLTNVGDKTRIDISNAALKLDLAGKKVKITAKVRLNVPANVAQPGIISKAQPEATIKVKL
jgi:acetolactate synthase small subunit